MMRNKTTIPANLANQQGVVHCQAGDIAKGVECFRQAARLAPDVFEYHLNLGRAFNLLKQWREAEDVLAVAHSLAPGEIDIHIAMADAFAGLGRREELLARYRHEMVERPGDTVLRRNAAAVLLQLGNAQEAARLAREVVTAVPKDVEAGLILASSLAATGQFEQSEQALLGVLAAKPRHAQAGYQLGVVRMRRGHYEAAASAFENVLRIAPDHVEAMHLLAASRLRTGQVNEAILLFKRVLALRPNRVTAQRDYASALAYRGSVSEAATRYRADLAIAPDDKDIRSALAFTSSLLPSATRAEILEIHREWGRRHGTFAPPAYGNAREPERRLKIGYVSPDFREHSISYFVEPLLSAHDRGAFEVFCYTLDGAFDATSQRLRAASDHWLALDKYNDDDAVRLIRADGIDILVDLAGHTASNRLTLFARGAAPVQITWLGYPETTSVPAIGYKITDAVVSPPGEADRYATEILLRLPNGFHCYRPPLNCPDVAPLPGLAIGHITFGSFADLPKMNPELIGVWAAVLRAAPGSRMLIKCRQFADETVRDKYTAMFGTAGVAAERLTLMGRSATTAAHLAQYASMDICLDTYPYNGTTTICEALWMGVPVVTWMGERAASRVGGSVLHQAGLSELIASNVEGYVGVATELARDVARLDALRRGMRDRLGKSALRDEHGFARAMETAYREVWRRWCSEAP